MADWGMIQQPNFAAAALSGYQAGSAIGKQRRLDAALGGVDLERPETILPVLQAGDAATGAALLGTSMRMAQYKHELAGKAALSDYLLALGPSSSSGGLAAGNVTASPEVAPPQAPTAPPQPSAATDASTDTSVDGDIVVNAPKAGPTLEDARQALIRSDPENYIKVETSIGAMNKAQREALDAANDTFGAAIEGARNMPYEQRKAYIAQLRPQLIAHGVPAEQVDSFDPTDQNIGAIEAQVLGVKGILERQDKDRSFALDQAKFGEAQRHNRVGEANAAANVGIAAGHLALDRQTEARVAAGGAGTIVGAIAAPATRAAYESLPAGTRYRAPDGSVRVKH